MTRDITCSFVGSTFIVSTLHCSINKNWPWGRRFGTPAPRHAAHPSRRLAAHPSRLECAVEPREASGSYKGVGEGVELLDLAVRVSRRRCRSSRSRLSCDRAMWPTTSKLSASRK